VNVNRTSSGPALEAAIAELARALRGARRIVALTGAGLSAESGIPTFRGAGGLWRNFSPQDLATPEAFARNPRLVWEWYDWRRDAICRAEPNPGHGALALLERRSEGGFTLVTQNVDGLDDRAGIPAAHGNPAGQASRNILKLHGDIWTVRCVVCGAEERNEEVPLRVIPPRCRCGALLRPGVVWFGEPLPPETWRRAEEASRRAEIFLVAGTSATVYPAAGLAEEARRSGARVAVVNLEPTGLDFMADWVLHGKSGEILPRLI